ncbi:metal ABC transporter ATP-binding protein [Pseudonocardiaceae bacterium YIM PH 21723]|nr:metal ABC transporter ATP-binding protein [Pseudonocardiaceae bacterium YIM PH 21723]
MSVEPGLGATALAPRPEPEPVVRLRGGRLRYGNRVLWDQLDLDIRPGEFVAVLGPNGSGKTSLIRVLLGLQQLAGGTVQIEGSPARRGNGRIGYIPQQRAVDPTLTVRGKDMVGMGLTGHRWGIGLPFGQAARERKRLVDQALVAVGASEYAHLPIGMLSGGEQQRLRVAQAVVGNPGLLLCDEPLLSLDLAHQRMVSQLVARRAREANTAVVFVTHEINPVLPLVDRVLYLVEGRFKIGTPDEVMTSETLSELFRTPISVLRVDGRLVVVGDQEPIVHHHVEA